MNPFKTLLVVAVGGALSLATAQSVSAQVVIAGPLVPIPNVAPPIVVPAPYPVLNTYTFPLAPPRVAGYGAYRPVGGAPVYVAPTPLPAPVVNPVGVVAPNVVYRPAVVGSSISGLPTVYVPGQPVRNALRYVVP